jgi:hypothetical protein
MKPWVRWTCIANLLFLISPAAKAQLFGWGAPAVEPAAAPAPAVEDPAKSNDPAVFCQGFDKKIVTIDGYKVPRYDIPEPKYLKCVPPQPKAPWIVTKEQWTQEDEMNWQNFVRSIGKSDCNTIDACLASKANPYRDQVDLDGVHYTDCADFPMYMRAYFSYKNHLPFSMVYQYEANLLTPEQITQVEARRKQEEAKGQLESFLKTLNDARYSINGNHPVSRYNIPHSRGAARDFYTSMDIMRDTTSSGSYRMFNTASDVLPDHYSPAITKQSIRPGTVLYKVTGHLALVYEVTPDGEIKYIDAHPDNSITRGSFNREYMRSNPFQGGGFRNWRPFKLVANEVGASGEDLPPKRNKDGSITIGKIKFLRDEEIPDYSAEQYYGNLPSPDWDWKKGKFVVGGREVNYFDYIRIRLANGIFKLSPTFQFRKDLNALCVDLQERTRSVQIAIDNQLHMKDHPLNLPLNIYGADGEWESFSTPGRDLRIRQRALNLIDNAKEYMAKWASKDPYFEYNGSNLKKDLIKIYNEVDANCRISYVKSDKQEVRMSLSTALSRVTRMSFDPYFCPERRWGARTEAEMRSCIENADKAEWYEYTQFLRNQVIRDPTEVMGYSLADVKRISEVQAQDAQDTSSRFNIQRALLGL